jgi:hypothetical protein
MTKLTAALFLLQFYTARTAGQTSVLDTVFIQQAKDKARIQYQQFEGDQSRLYNGKLYRDYTIPLTEGHPYFHTDQFETGSIRYDGMVFDSVQVLYNVVTEEVITPHFNKVQWISLRNDKIAAFTFGGHHFIKIISDSTTPDIATGFYQQLYAGKTSVLKKRSKFVVEGISNNQLVRTIKVVERRYLWHDGNWHRVSSLRSVLKLLKGHNAAIRQHLRSAKIKYRKRPDEALAKIASYYDQLTAGK